LTGKSEDDLTETGEFGIGAYPGGTMTAISPETRTEEEFSELDQLEVIDSTEMKLSGAYHSYYYYAVSDDGEPIAVPVE
jgi:hypothetical protein